MAALLYKDFLIVAIGQLEQESKAWIPVAAISRHSAAGREGHTIHDSAHCSGSEQEAEAFALEAAKAWVDARTKAA